MPHATADEDEDTSSRSRSNSHPDTSRPNGRVQIREPGWIEYQANAGHAVLERQERERQEREQGLPAEDAEDDEGYEEAAEAAFIEEQEPSTGQSLRTPGGLSLHTRRRPHSYLRNILRRAAVTLRRQYYRNEGI